LGLLEELRLPNAAVAAIARFRLAGRGELLAPQGTASRPRRRRATPKTICWTS
jgi:hypothetical protein